MLIGSLGSLFSGWSPRPLREVSRSARENRASRPAGVRGHGHTIPFAQAAESGCKPGPPVISRGQVGVELGDRGGDSWVEVRWAGPHRPA